MRNYGRLLSSVATFFVVTSALYWIFAREPAGTTALLVTAGLTGMIGYYALFVGRRIERQPEDDPHADVADGAGDVGFFSPGSWWPLPLALSVAVSALGFVFGFWLLALGAGALAISLYGFVLEYTRRP